MTATNHMTICSHKKRVIDRLRDHFGGSWEYSFTANRWIHADGWYIYPAFQLFTGEDEGGYTQYWTNGGVQVFGLRR